MHDVIALTITDPREIDLPDIGIMNLEDAETGDTFLFDTSSQQSKKEYRLNSLRLHDERKRLFRSINVDHIDIHTNIPYTQELYKFFRMRERRV
jgi:hypothetical protein